MLSGKELINKMENWKMSNILAASMYFWSVSLIYRLFGQFLIFLVDQKKFG